MLGILKSHYSRVRTSNQYFLKAPQVEPWLGRAHSEGLLRPSSPPLRGVGANQEKCPKTQCAAFWG